MKFFTKAKSLFVFCLFAVSLLKAQTWQTPIQVGGNYLTTSINSTYFISATHGWAVGNGGTILSTSNGGTNWTAQTSGTTTTLRSVYFTSATQGWVVGDDGTILTTSNGGTTWTAQTSGTTATLASVYFISATRGWVVGSSGTIRTTSDGGISWTAQTSGTTQQLLSVYFTSATQGWAVGFGGTILTTINGGTTWTAQTSGTTQPLWSVYFTSATQGWAVGSGGTIRTTSNGGTTWTAQTSGTTANLISVYFISATRGWAVGFAGIIRTTSDGGTTWADQTSGATQTLRSVYFTSATQGWAVGEFGNILTTSNGGTNWSAQTSSTTTVLRGVYFTSATQGWVVGDGGTILTTSNGGGTWTTQTSGTTQQFRSVYFTSATQGWAVGSGGAIRTTSNGGITWTAQTSGTTATLLRVYFTSATQGWAVGDAGTIVTTSNGGGTWTAQTSGTLQQLWSVYFTNATQGWAVGSSGTIRTTSNGGGTWTAQTSGTTQQLRSVYFTSATQGWAVGSGGTILTTSDGGTTWTPQTSGTTQQLWSVYFTSATQGWAVGDGGTIVTTSNGGGTWTAQTSGTIQTLWNVYFTNATQGCAVGDVGTILLYTAPASTPTITSFSPTNAKPSDAVTITGTNFNTTSGNNIVFFGATRATVNTATATSLNVTVPTGATYGAITVLNTGTSLAAYSTQFFNPTFTPNKGSITSTDILPKVDFATGVKPSSVAIGDLDGDGKPDLAVANYNSASVSVFRNISSSGSIGAGSFAAKQDFTTGNGPYSVAIGDLDGDGKPDLVVANEMSNTVSVFRNTSTSGSIGAGSFAAKVDFSTGVNPYSVAIGDLDGDGKPDMAVANFTSNTVSAFRNTATSGSITTSSFAVKVDFSTGVNPYSVAIGDLDRDGKADLAVANFNSTNVSVFRNTSTSGSIGASSFAAKVDFATGDNPISIAIGDLDGDGRADLAVANFISNTVSVFRNTATSGSISSGSFAVKVDFATGDIPRSVAIGDLDGDGKPDLAVANRFSASVSVYRNTSTSGSLSAGSFAAKVDFATGSLPFSVAIGDLDGDSKPDLMAANFSSNTVSVLRNADIPLPSVLGSFTVDKVNTSALLKFTTFTEINSDYILVEHSADGNIFNELEKMAAKGNSSTPSNYSMVHSKPINGLNYYRLKLVDKDGKYSYSEVRRLDISKKSTELIVYPNPAKGGKLNVDYGEDVSNNTLYTITTVDGRLVQQGILVNRQQTINISSLRHATYMLKVGSKKPVLFIKE